MRYRQYCPVARATEIVGDRWTLLIVRELLAGSRHFNAIHRGLPGVSRSLLASRLRHLQDGGVVERVPGARARAMDYALTEAGHGLKPLIERLGAWGARWAFGDPKVKELDPALLLWKIHQRIRRDLLPAARTVVEFDLSGPRGRRLWLVLQRHDVSVCLKPPGYDSQLVVRTEVKTLYRVWLGEVEYAAAVRCRAVVVEGPRPLVQALPKWFLWSPMAGYVREAAAAEDVLIRGGAETHNR